MVHQELRRLAHCYMAGQHANGTLQSTALVNEAFLRLVECDRLLRETHFFCRLCEPDVHINGRLCPVAHLPEAQHRVRPSELNEELDCLPQRDRDVVEA